MNQRDKTSISPKNKFNEAQKSKHHQEGWASFLVSPFSTLPVDHIQIKHLDFGGKNKDSLG